MEHRSDLNKARTSYDEYKRNLRNYQNGQTEIEAKQERIRKIDERLNKASNQNRQKNYEQQLADIATRLKALQVEEVLIKEKQESLRKNLSSGAGNEANILKQQKKELQKEINEKRKKVDETKQAIGKMESFLDEKKS